MKSLDYVNIDSENPLYLILLMYMDRLKKAIEINT